MKTTLSLLALTTALGTVMVAPVAARTAAPVPIQSHGATTDLSDADALLLFADNDSDEDDEDEDDEDDDDDGDDDDSDDGDDEGNAACDDAESDDDQPCTEARKAAPQGRKSLPANGLFGNGAAPQVKVN